MQDISFNLKLVEFISILLHKLRAVEEHKDLMDFIDEFISPDPHKTNPSNMTM